MTSAALTLRPVRLAHDRSPLHVYLAGLASGASRETMLGALERVAGVFGLTAKTCPWHLLRFQHLMAIRAWSIEHGYSPSRVNLFRAAMRSVLRIARGLELLSEDEYQRAMRVPGVRGERLPAGRAIARAELRALFVRCRERGNIGTRDAALMALLYGTGLRRAEAAALDLEDLEGITLRVRGKGNKVRLVNLPPGAQRALDAWLEVRGRDPGPLFVAVINGQLKRRHLWPGTIRGTLARLASSVGVKSLSPHDFRRTFVSDLLDLGTDLPTVQKMAGHASPVTTARYDRRDERAAQRAAERLDVPY